MPAEADRPSTGPTDAELLARCAAQDKAAFRSLYAAWSGRLHGVAMRITRDPGLAADATHDAFVQVWQQAGRFDPAKGEAGSWLMTLARYRALDMVRRRGREVFGHEVADEPDVAPDALSQLVSAADGGALYRCMELLSAERRHLIVLAFVEGFSHSQLALKKNLPVGTVKSWIRRSLLGLKECLAT